VAFVIHLSDLHVGSGDPEEEVIRSALVGAVADELGAREGTPALLAVTGDVFDDARAEPDVVVPRFLELLDALFERLGSQIPTVILPGNHDRRASGFIRTRRERVWDGLRERIGSRAYVHGLETPFLDAVLPDGFAQLPAWIMAYDSSYLPVGLLSAGGIIRPQDILRAAHRIRDRNPDWPVIFMLHHHLIPTPLTDTGRVELEGRWAPVRWGVEHLLPRIVANADREELTMTALGSGTALSTLHTLGRPILVLHGHKHYATARHLGAMQEGQGDVLLVAAGSAGKAQPWFPTTSNDAARLWPSFNLIRLEGAELDVDIVSFGYADDGVGDRAVRPLVRARRDGPRWRTATVPGGSAFTTERRLELNELVCVVSRSSDASRWDVDYRRRFDGSAADAPKSFRELVDAVEDGELQVEATEGARAEPSDDHPPFSITLHRGEPARFRIRRALFRRFEHAAEALGPRHAPYAWLGVMNRYLADRCRLEIRGPAEICDRAFASRTDLGTGLEEPCRVERTSTGVVIEFDDCPPRTLLRIYWPLDAE
jgi:3',5'-cyclic AMP phosphodiesterase CpdA